jgi:hypothetical protein
MVEISPLLYGSIKPLHAKSGLRHEVRDMNKVECRNETRLGNLLKKLAQSLARGRSCMTVLQMLGVSVELLAVFLAILLYRTVRLGTYMHASPYVVILVGAILLALAPDTKNPLAVTLLFFVSRLVVHALVYYDLLKDTKG